MKAFLTFAAAVFVVSAVPADAVTIAVTNPSFETLPPGGLPSPCGESGCFASIAPIPGWVTTGVTGQFRPASSYDFVPDGLTVAFSNGGTITQTVGVTAVSGATYTLTAALGNRSGGYSILTASNPASIRLVVGSNTIVATGNFPASGSWSTYTASYQATLADAGSAISIELVSPGVQGGFDNIVLSGSNVPEPASWALMIGGFGLTGAAMRRRRVLSAG